MEEQKMNSINDIQDEKVRHLATTLKQSGLAASETEAIRMATAMSHTSNKVNQTFEDRKHTAPTGLGYKREEKKSTQEKEQPTLQSAPDKKIDIPRTAEQIVASMRENEAANAIPTTEPRTQNPETQTTETSPRAENIPEPDLSKMNLAEATGQEIPEEPASSDNQNAEPSEPERVEEKEDYKIEFKDDEEFIVQDVKRTEETQKPETSENQNPESRTPNAESQKAENEKPKFHTPERKPKKDISEMEESKVDLGSVFNFNK